MAYSDSGKIPYERANNVEVSLFLAQGRIRRRAFLFRFLVCIAIWFAFHLLNVLWASEEYFNYLALGGGKIQDGAAVVELRYNIFSVIEQYILPVLILTFMTIQFIKRAHDVNKSGWFILVPVYNLYLLFAKGTDDDNNYGVKPQSSRQVPAYKWNNNE